MFKRMGVVVALGIGIGMGQAGAALHNRGGGMIYDDELNITWLANANQGAGSSYDNGFSASDGLMTWVNAFAWADNLVYGGYGDWRLPTVADTGTSGCDFSYGGGTDCGYNVEPSTGELAHLWYVTLGNKASCPPGDVTCAGGPQTGWGLTNTGPFINVQTGLYWSGTEYAPNPNRAWVFITSDGFQGYTDKRTETYAWAVRTGDVARVPVPGTFALLGLGLGLIGLDRARGRR